MMEYAGAFVVWAVGTIAFGLVQAHENRAALRRGIQFPDRGPYWAPVWWIMLTWPFWLVEVPVRALVLAIRGRYDRG